MLLVYLMVSAIFTMQNVENLFNFHHKNELLNEEIHEFSLIFIFLPVVTLHDGLLQVGL